MRRLLPSALAASFVVSACSGPTPPPPPPPPATVRTTYRVLGGVSMGAIGTMALGSTHPDQLDALAALGGPVDGAFFQRFIDRFVGGGFCSQQELEAIMAQGPHRLNDPSVIDVCATPRVAQPQAPWEHPNDFNHLHVTNSGGTFDRESYIELMTDLMLAYGNFFTENPASPLAPPGVDPALARKPPANICSNPVRVQNLKNAEYNPDGTYDAITFCDGFQRLYFCANGKERVDFCSDPANITTPLAVANEQAFANSYCAAKGGVIVASKDVEPMLWLTHAGNVDPCRARVMPVPILLAYDYNGNGRRDYGEPIVNNSQERYDDVGVDGCADAFENGTGGCNGTASATPTDANGDNYDVDKNPTGTENSWRWEPGEPFKDLGLDGVAGSGDRGEGNGEFDQAAGRQRLFALDARSNFKKLEPSAFARLNVFIDGGIRDIFNFGLMGKHLFSVVKAARASVGEYRDFLDIPGMRDRSTGAFNPWNRAWRTLPKDMITLYGKDTRTDEEIIIGEGDHVGTVGQAAARFQSLFNWVAWQWPNAPMPQAVFGQSSPAAYRTETFTSTKLGAKWEYAIAIPPGYDDPANAEARYPVAYLLHGYGMDPSNFAAAGALANNFVTDPALKLRPVIYVFPNGRCCSFNATTGERDCRNTNDAGEEISRLPGWQRECVSGTFWVNRKGYTPDDGTPYGDALFELMDYIDVKYRTLKPADVEAR